MRTDGFEFICGDPGQAAKRVRRPKSQTTSSADDVSHGKKQRRAPPQPLKVSARKAADDRTLSGKRDDPING